MDSFQQKLSKVKFLKVKLFLYKSVQQVLISYRKFYLAVVHYLYFVFKAKFSHTVSKQYYQHFSKRFLDPSFAYKATAWWTHTQTHLSHIITMSFSERFSKAFQKILEQSKSLWSSLKACYMQSSNLSFSSRWDETYFNIYLWPRGCYTLLFLWLASHHWNDLWIVFICLF